MYIQYPVLFLIFLLGCAQVNLSKEQIAFKEKCLAEGHEWMNSMSEMKEGMMAGPPCPGCMPDEKNHICTQEEYEAYVK